MKVRLPRSILGFQSRFQKLFPSATFGSKRLSRIGIRISRESLNLQRRSDAAVPIGGECEPLRNHRDSFMKSENVPTAKCLNKGVQPTKGRECANLVCLSRGVHPRRMRLSCDVQQNDHSIIPTLLRTKSAERRHREVGFAITVEIAPHECAFFGGCLWRHKSAIANTYGHKTSSVRTAR